MLFSVATLPSNRPANPVQKGSCLLKFLMLRWWENPRHPKSSNYLVRRCKRTLRKFSLWRCFGGSNTDPQKVWLDVYWETRIFEEVMVNGGLNWWILVVWVGIARLPNHHTQTIIFFAICWNLRTTKLPYIKGLGCRGIWISPIFQCLGGVSSRQGGRKGVVSSWCFFAGSWKIATIVSKLG